MFALFFVLPLLFVVIVSFWDYNDYQMLPVFTTRSYTESFEGCLTKLPDLCTMLRTYASTDQVLRNRVGTDPRAGLRDRLFSRIPHQIRDGADGAVPRLHHSVLDFERHPHDLLDPAARAQWAGQPILVGSHIVDQPLEWLLFSPFSVALAFVHLFTFFMVAPIFNSMMRIDRRLMEAAYDAGASGWQMLTNVVIPLSKPGIAIGSIFVVTIVMGDFITFDVMGGEQIASAGKVVETRLQALQFPPAAANAVILLCATMMIIAVLNRIVDIRKEL